MPIINILAVMKHTYEAHVLQEQIFYIPNPTKYLNLTTTLLNY